MSRVVPTSFIRRAPSFGLIEMLLDDLNARGQFLSLKV
jgi:hypothetical protein